MRWSILLMLLVVLFVGGCGHSTAYTHLEAARPIHQAKVCAPGGPSWSCTRGWYYEDGAAEKRYVEELNRWVRSEDYDSAMVNHAKNLGYKPKAHRKPSDRKLPPDGYPKPEQDPK